MRLLSSLLLVLSLCCYSSWIVSAEHTSSNYIVLLDAGSSGTRVHIHQFESTQPLAKIHPSVSMKVKPGLTMFPSSTEACDSIRPLIEFAQAHVPEQLRATTPIYLLATAGMRVVDTHIATEIMTTCSAILQQSPFHFQSHHAQIISGTQEGINGWIATNYLLGALQNGTETVGVLELGGASFQLTFAVEEVDHSHYPTGSLIELSLGGRTYHVYTHSFLNYGLEKAQELFHSKFGDQLTSENPCYPQNYLHSTSGHYDTCVAYVDQLIHDEQWLQAIDDETHVCHSKVCRFGGIQIPHIRPTQPFVAIENFFYTTEFFGLLEEEDVISGLKSSGRSFCTEDWNHLPSKYPRESESDLSKYCFSAAYLPRVLERGLGFTNTQQITFTKFVNGVQMDWALGQVLLYVMNGTEQYNEHESFVSDGGVKAMQPQAAATNTPDITVATELSAPLHSTDSTNSTVSTDSSDSSDSTDSPRSTDSVDSSDSTDSAALTASAVLSDGSSASAASDELVTAYLTRNHLMLYVGLLALILALAHLKQPPIKTVHPNVKYKYS